MCVRGKVWFLNEKRICPWRHGQRKGSWENHRFVENDTCMYGYRGEYSLPFCSQISALCVRVQRVPPATRPTRTTARPSTPVWTGVVCGRPTLCRVQSASSGIRTNSPVSKCTTTPFATRRLPPRLPMQRQPPRALLRPPSVGRHHHLPS